MLLNSMDHVSPEARSRIMAAVRSTGNRTTERRFRAILVRHGFRGWRMHASELSGKPDFVFDAHRLAIFIDGCFWHKCPLCFRAPSSSLAYWEPKIASNVARDARSRRKLNRKGWSVMRIWEHELRDGPRVLARLTRALARGEKRGGPVSYPAMSGYALHTETVRNTGPRCR